MSGALVRARRVLSRLHRGVTGRRDAPDPPPPAVETAPTGGVALRADTGALHGWLFDPLRPDAVFDVAITVDGVPAAVIPANLLAFGEGRPFEAIYNGFEWTLPETYRTDGRIHIVAVRSAAGAELAGSPLLIENWPAAGGKPRPAFRLVDRDPAVSAQPRPAGSDRDWVQVLPPEPRVTSTRALTCNNPQAGGLYGHRSYQPWLGYMAYLRDVFVDPRHGLVFNAQGELWTGTHYLRDGGAINLARETILTDPGSAPHVPGDTLIFSQSMFTNYWHWHTDCLPILHQAQSVLRDEHTVLTPPLTGWRKRSADMLLDASRTLEQDSLVRVDGVYCSAHLDGRSNFPDADVMATFARLRAAAGAAVGPVADGDRVFLSRKDATAGRLLENEDELFAALAPYGFQHRLMSELDYADQIRLFAGASMVVGSHGAGLTNLGFCSPGCVVFEIIELSRLIGAMRYLSVRAGLNHHWYSVGDDQSARLDVPAFMTYFEAQAAP